MYQPDTWVTTQTGYVGNSLELLSVGQLQGAQKEAASVPWKETCAVDQRVKFVEEWIGHTQRGVSMAQLCRSYGISRKTGYKWIHRYDWHGSMRNLSSRPHSHPKATPAKVVERVVALKRQHPFFGPRKIRKAMLNARLKRVPAASTIGHLLDAHG